MIWTITIFYVFLSYLDGNNLIKVDFLPLEKDHSFLPYEIHKHIIKINFNLMIYSNRYNVNKYFKENFSRKWFNWIILSKNTTLNIISIWYNIMLISQNGYIYIYVGVYAQTVRSTKRGKLNCVDHFDPRARDTHDDNFDFLELTAFRCAASFNAQPRKSHQPAYALNRPNLTYFCHPRSLTVVAMCPFTLSSTYLRQIYMFI